MITLSGITWDHPRGRAPLEASLAPWRERSGVTVRWTARSLKDFGDASLAELAATYDLLVIDHPHAGYAAASGCITPLDSLLSPLDLATLGAHSAGPSFNSYHYAGHQWALPVDAACQVACGRPDLLHDQRLPATWDEVLALATALRARGLHVGMALCPTDTLCSTLTLCAQAGDPFREGPDGFPAEATLRRVLQRLRSLVELCHPDSLTWNPIRLYDYMASHDDVAYCPLAFGYSNYSRTGYARRPLAFGPVPGRTNALLGGAGIAVSAAAAHPQAAAAYALWLCSSDYQSGIYTSSGGQPGHGAAWRSADADRATGGFLSATRSTLEAAHVRPRHSGWPAFQEFLGERVHAWLRNPGSESALCEELHAAFAASSPR